jgi:HPt (histidine-containing phosphotransfer) domain-containing protein
VAPATGPPLLDVADLKRRMGGDIELAGEVLAMFREEHGKVLAQVAAAVAAADATELRAAAHGLKGMAANVSAQAVRELCLAMEKLAAAGELDEAQALLSRLRDTMASTVEHIGVVLAKGID